MITDRELELKINESFDKITADNNKKAEIYDKIINTEFKTKEKFDFSFFNINFKRALPYAAACVCLLIVVSLGFSGGFDYVFSKYGNETAAYSLETMTESTACTAEATDLIADRMIESEIPEEKSTTEGYEDTIICEADDCGATISQEFYVLQNDGTFIAYDFVLSEYDPLTIWQQYQDLNSILLKVNLIEYKFDELNKIITINFSKDLNDLIKENEGYNLFISIGETYKSFYPEYRFSVKVDSELLMIQGKQVDFKSHHHIILEN